MNSALPDPQAVLANAGWVRRLAYSLVGDTHAAEDLVQDALLVAMEQSPDKLKRAERGATVPRAWFSAVLRNLAAKSRRSAGRRDARERSAAQPERQPHTVDRLTRAALHQSVVSAVLELDELHRTVILMRYLEELPPRRIAKQLRVPVNTVHTRIARGIERLRAKLDTDEGGREAWLPGLLVLCEAPKPVIRTILGGLAVSTKAKAILTVAVGLVALIGGMNLLGNPAEPVLTESEPVLATDVAAATSGTGPMAPFAQELAAKREEVPSQVPVSEAATTQVAWLTVKLTIAEADMALPNWPISMRPTGQPSTKKTTRSLHSDEHGLIHLELAPHEAFTLESRGQNGPFRPLSHELQPLQPGETREVALALVTAPDEHFFGRVVDSAGAPIGNAEVRMHNLATWAKAEGGWGEQGSAQTWTDADGNFELELFTWKASVLRLRAKGFGDRMATISLAHASPIEARSIQMLCEAQLKISVGGTAKNSFEGFLVRAKVNCNDLLAGQTSRWNYAWSPEAKLEGRTDAAGTLALRGLPSSVPITVDVFDGSKLVHRELDLHLAEGEQRELHVQLGLGTELWGTVVNDAGESVAGLEIWLQKGSHPAASLFNSQSEHFAAVRSETGGSYHFEGVPPGAWTVGPAPTRKLFAPASAKQWAGLTQSIEIAAGVQEQHVDLTVHQGLFLRGHTRDSQGEPISEAFVSGMKTGLWGGISSYVESDGAFAIGPLVPGEYVVMGKSTGRGAATQAVPITAEAGAVDLELLFWTGGSIGGKILRPAGKEDIGYQVHFQRSDGTGIPVTWKTSDDTSPEFERNGIDAGLYNVIARTNDGGVGVLTGIEVRHDRPVTGLEIVIEPGTPVVIWFEGEQKWATLELWQGQTYLAGGNFAPGDRWRQVVPVEAVGPHGDAGHLTVKLRTPDGETNMLRVPLELNGMTEVKMELR